MGRVTSLTYAPGKSVRYSYDSRGLLARVTDWIGGATDFAYDDARQLVTVSRPNGVITRRAYDADGRVISIEEARGDVLAGIQLTRDAGGRVISAQRNLPVEPDLTALAAREFTYDAAGQIAAYTYDSLSRRKADDARTYTWDLAGRLAAYASGDTVISNNYDSFGLRIGRGDQTYVLNYAFATPVLAVVRNAGQDLRYYVQTPDGRLLYSINAVDDSRRYYHFDENGSTTLLTDDSGAITDAYAITPNGDLATHLGSTDNPFTFQGESGVMQEDAGLYYGREGYFDANSLSRPSLSPPLPATPQVIEPPAAPGLLPATETALQRGPSLPSPALPVLSAVLPGLPLPSIPDVQPLCNLVGQVSGLPGLADGTNPLLQALYCMRSNPQPWP
ncbi:MAG: hypothetical protein HYR60_15110 [Acidobacteria bacterium]|nr:hypothetical protein [Acidobacteriota bacterium]